MCFQYPRFPTDLMCCSGSAKDLYTGNLQRKDRNSWTSSQLGEPTHVAPVKSLGFCSVDLTKHQWAERRRLLASLLRSINKRQELRSFFIPEKPSFSLSRFVKANWVVANSSDKAGFLFVLYRIKNKVIGEKCIVFAMANWIAVAEMGPQLVQMETALLKPLELFPFSAQCCPTDSLRCVPPLTSNKE